MSIDLMGMVKQAATKQILGKLGGMLGTDEKKTTSMFETAAGSILGGLMKKAATPEGANEIFRATQDQDDGILDNLGDLLGGGKATEDFQKQGGGMLDMIFGSNRGGILGIIAKFLGLSGGKESTLMSLAAPMVMGVLGKQIKNKALDAVGLGKLLGDQKQYASKWGMPSSLTNDLGFGNLLGNVGDAGRAVAGAVGGAVDEVGDRARQAGRATARAAGDAADAGMGFMKWLLPLAILALLAFAFWKFVLPNFSAPALPDIPEVSFKVPELPTGVSMPDGFDMKGLTGQFEGITSGFKGLTVDNAGGLADKIKGLSDSMGSMGLDKLEGGAKEYAGKMFNDFGSTLNKSVGQIKEEGILSKLRPALDILMNVIKKFFG